VCVCVCGVCGGVCVCRVCVGGGLHVCVCVCVGVCVGRGGEERNSALLSIYNNHCALKWPSHQAIILPISILHTMLLASNPEDAEFLKHFYIILQKTDGTQSKLEHDPSLSIPLSLPSVHKYHIWVRLPLLLGCTNVFCGFCNSTDPSGNKTHLDSTRLERKSDGCSCIFKEPENKWKRLLSMPNPNWKSTWNGSKAEMDKRDRNGESCPYIPMKFMNVFHRSDEETNYTCRYILCAVS